MHPFSSSFPSITNKVAKTCAYFVSICLRKLSLHSDWIILIGWCCFVRRNGWTWCWCCFFRWRRWVYLPNIHIRRLKIRKKYNQIPLVWWWKESPICLGTTCHFHTKYIIPKHWWINRIYLKLSFNVIVTFHMKKSDRTQTFRHFWINDLCGMDEQQTQTIRIRMHAHCTHTLSRVLRNPNDGKPPLLRN